MLGVYAHNILNNKAGVITSDNLGSFPPLKYHPWCSSDWRQFTVDSQFEVRPTLSFLSYTPPPKLLQLLSGLLYSPATFYSIRLETTHCSSTCVAFSDRHVIAPMPTSSTALNDSDPSVEPSPMNFMQLNISAGYHLV